MKIQNICGKVINVKAKPLKAKQKREVDFESQEIKNLVKRKYVKVIK